MKKLLGVMCALVLLTGCVTKDLSVEDRQQVKTLKVLPVFVAVDNFQYTSMTQAWGAGLGAGAGAATGMASGASTSGTSALTGVGSVAGTKMADAATVSISQAIRNNMTANNIDLAQLIRQSFTRRIQQERLFTVVGENDKADAEVEIIVSQWGLSLKNYSTVLYPVIGATAQIKRNGSAVWRNFDTISVFNDANTIAYTPEQYATDPEAPRKAFTHVSDLLVNKLVEHLQR